jgi:hypothetical protein
MFKKILLTLLVLFVLIQFFRIDKTVPEFDRSKDFMEITQPIADVRGILITTCYDCHSHETRYPWYSQVAPVSWWVKHHINDGKKHLNFSEWGLYSAKKADHKLDECIEEVGDGKMPLKSYTWTHEDAQLSKDQVKLLEDFFVGLRTGLSEDVGEDLDD